MSYDGYGFVNETHEKDFSAGFSQFWPSGCFSDFTIVVDDFKEFHVHKTVLSIHSPFFTAMFKNDMQEQLTGKMKIPNFTTKAVEQFLAFMYTGRLKDESQLMDILALAALYDVPKLKLMCEEIIRWNIDTTNVLDIISLADLYSSKILKEAAFAAVKKMFPGRKLPDELLKNPENIKTLIKARNIREGRFQDADLEFEVVCRSMNVTKDFKTIPNRYFDSDWDDWENEQRIRDRGINRWSDSE